MKIAIEEETLRRIKGFTHLADGEVGGMGRVIIKDRTPYIHDLKLLPDQKVTGASVIVDNLKLALFLSTVTNPEEFRFLWHSHVNMQACLSSIDLRCIDSFLETSPYLISCVSSKKGKMFIQFDGVINGLRIVQNCTLQTIPEEYDDLKAELNSHIIQDTNPFRGFIEDEDYSFYKSTERGKGFNYGLFGNLKKTQELFRNRKNIDIESFGIKDEDIKDE